MKYIKYMVGHAVHTDQTIKLYKKRYRRKKGNRINRRKIVDKSQEKRRRVQEEGNKSVSALTILQTRPSALGMSDPVMEFLEILETQESLSKF